MNKIKQIGRSTERFIENHKVGIAVTLTALTCVSIARASRREFDDFLKEHDLLDAFNARYDNVA